MTVPTEAAQETREEGAKNMERREEKRRKEGRNLRELAYGAHESSIPTVRCRKSTRRHMLTFRGRLEIF